MKRFHDICISRRSEWDDLNARSKALYNLECEVEELRKKLKSYETGCINKGAHCAACKNGRETGHSILIGQTYDCVLEMPCSKFEDKGEHKGI